MSVWLLAMVLRLALALEVPGGPVGKRAVCRWQEKVGSPEGKSKKKSAAWGKSMKTPTLEESSHVISASGKNHKDRVLFLRDENQCGTPRSVPRLCIIQPSTLTASFFYYHSMSALRRGCMYEKSPVINIYTKRFGYTNKQSGDVLHITTKTHRRLQRTDAYTR